MDRMNGRFFAHGVSGSAGEATRQAGAESASAVTRGARMGHQVDGAIAGVRVLCRAQGAATRREGLKLK
jgi:hypothetical protein